MELNSLIENQVSENLLTVEDSPDAIKIDLKDENSLSSPSIKASPECIQALEAISIDPWDISSWMIYLEEVENCRCGSIEQLDAFKSFLERFPRSTKFWRKIFELYNSIDAVKADETLLIGCKICWDVDLWYSYIEMKLNKVKPDRVEVESIFDSALEFVGYSIDSYQLWKLYIDYLLSIIDDSNRKEIFSQIYHLFQRAFCIPMENYDSLLKCFDDFDKSCKKYYPDPNDFLFSSPDKLKVQEIKDVLKAKKRLISNIIFDRLAVPSVGSSSEQQQIELWDQLIRFVNNVIIFHFS